MKKTGMAGLALWIAGAALAQEQGKPLTQEPLQQGRIVYEHTVQMQIRFAGMNDQMPQMLPRSRTNKLELLFNGEQSLRRNLPDDVTDNNGEFGNASFDGGGGRNIQIKTFGPGNNDIAYVHLGRGITVEQREFATKNYIITDSISKLNWKLTGEAKTILGYACQKAVAQRIGTRMGSQMVNGEIKREQVADTSNITAWFTTTIPVSTGPAYAGQLPGLVLEIEVNDGRETYKATEVSPKVNVSDIKEPKSGKKITRSDFEKEVEKTMQEMQRNNGGRMMFRG